MSSRPSNTARAAFPTRPSPRRLAAARPSLQAATALSPPQRRRAPYPPAGLAGCSAVASRPFFPPTSVAMRTSGTTPPSLLFLNKSGKKLNSLRIGPVARGPRRPDHTATAQRDPRHPDRDAEDQDRDHVNALRRHVLRRLRRQREARLEGGSRLISGWAARSSPDWRSAAVSPDSPRNVPSLQVGSERECEHGVYLCRERTGGGQEAAWRGQLLDAGLALGARAWRGWPAGQP